MKNFQIYKRFWCWQIPIKIFLNCIFFCQDIVVILHWTMYVYISVVIKLNIHFDWVMVKIKNCVQNIQVLISDLFQSWKIKAGEVVPCLKNQCEYANMNIPYTRHALMMVTKQTRTPPKHNYTDTHSCIYYNMLTIRHKHMHMEPAHLWPTFIWCCLRGYLWGEVSRDWGFFFPTFWLP